MAPILMLMLFWGIFSDQSCATEITVEELLLQNEWLSGSSIDVQDDQGYVLKTLGKEDISVIIEDYVDSYPTRQWTPSLEVGPWNKCKDVDETVNLGFKKIHIKFKVPMKSKVAKLVSQGGNRYMRLECVPSSVDTGRILTLVEAHPSGACIIVEVLPNGIKVTLSAGRLRYSETITVPNPKPICHKLPGLEIVDICLALYNLNFKELSGCARIDISVKVKTFKIDLGCFKLKQVQEEPVQRADTLSDNNLLLF